MNKGPDLAAVGAVGAMLIFGIVTVENITPRIIGIVQQFGLVFMWIGAILTASVGIGLVMAGITKAARAAWRK